jgi:ABC-2 type transport system permease protein
VAWVLVRLRLRLLVNGLQVGTQQVLSLVLGSIFGLVAAILALAILIAAATDEGWHDAVVVFLAVVWVAWIVLPAVSFASDSTLDPRRFATLPLTHRELVPGLLAAALVGIGPVATLLASSGVAIGAGRLSGRAVIGMIALAVVVLAVLACVAWSRAILAVASDLLTSRRGREIAGLIAMVVLGAIAFGPQLMTGVTFRPDQGQLATVAEIAAWTPGGLAAAAITAMVDGAYGIAALRVLGVAMSVVAALAIWAWALRRTEVAPPTRTATGRTSTSLYPRLLAPLPRTRLTAVSVRFLRTVTRDARVRMQAFSTTFVMIPLFVFSATAIPGDNAPLYASYLVIPFGLLAANQYGMDGPALWQHEVAGEAPSTDLLGRNLALGLLALPVAAIGAVGLAVTFDAWTSLPAALLLSLATLLIMFGVSNTAAAVVPYPIPEDPSNIFGGGTSGAGFVQGMMALVVMLVHGLLVAPALLITMLVSGQGTRLAASAISVVYGAAMLAAGTWAGSARARGRGPELLAAVDPRGG